MKKLLGVAVVALSVAIGCSETTKKEASEAAKETGEAIESAANDAVAAGEKAMAEGEKAIESVKQAMDDEPAAPAEPDPVSERP